MSGPVGDTPLAEKLRLEPGLRCLTVDAPAGFLQLFESLPPGAEFSTALSARYGWVMFFTLCLEQLIDKILSVLPLLEHDGLLWVAYPKTGSPLKRDLTRSDLWDVMRSHGYKAVTQVYIDPDWTAVRFRRLDLIGT